MSGFQLDKWYFDVVDDSHRAHIAYWARLSWRGLAVTWQSLASYTPGEAPRRRQSLGVRAGPQRHLDLIRWNAPAIGATLAVEPSVRAFSERLADGVLWECIAPAARVRLTRGSQLTVGAGYAERISMSVAPWTLPIRELRWGRWCSADGSRSVVWIEWRHEERRQWVYMDGAPVSATIEDGGVSGERFRLTLDGRETLEQRSFGEVARRIPGLSKLLPSSMRDMQEVKWLSSGVLHESDSMPTPGMSIHEVVTFG